MPRNPFKENNRRRLVMVNEILDLQELFLLPQTPLATSVKDPDHDQSKCQTPTQNSRLAVLQCEPSSTHLRVLESWSLSKLPNLVFPIKESSHGDTSSNIMQAQPSASNDAKVSRVGLCLRIPWPSSEA